MVTEIAFALGFHDSAYFTRLFSKTTGMSPTVYRRQAELSKVIQFTGPLGENPLERKEGIYNSVFQHEITLFKTGRMEGKSVGKLEVIGADYVQEESYAFSVERAEVVLDSAYILTEQNDLKIDGQITMKIMKTGGKVPGWVRTPAPRCASTGRIPCRPPARRTRPRS